ncbi:MAG: histidinol-phosphate transaminase [Candidatus Omnitrophica bacterium]|nr:histidinol-phosphate transaminase [Candidatus Omnitrophota bacterium]
MLVRKEILTVKPYIPGKPIDEVKRELGLRRVDKLASNESAYGPSPEVVKVLKEAAGEVYRYPDGQCYYLRRLLAKRLGVRPDELVFGNGSDELIILTLRAFLARGEEVVVARPSFQIYEIAAKIAGSRPKVVPLKNFTYDLQAMRRRITRKTKVIFIANPNNPTGTYVAEHDVRAFLKDLPKECLVFFDEAYFEYADQPDFPDLLSSPRRPRLIVARTFSKAYGLAGLRVGYCIADPRVALYLNRVREPFNVNILAQKAACAALRDQRHVQKVVGLTRQEKQFLYRAFDRRGVSYIPSAANFILFDCRRDSRRVMCDLLKQGVIVRDMASWGMKTYVRVTVGTRAENKRFLKALDAVL